MTGGDEARFFQSLQRDRHAGTMRAEPQCPVGHLRKPQRPREQESVVPEPLDSLVPLAQHFWVVEISQQQLAKSVGILV